MGPAVETAGPTLQTVVPTLEEVIPTLEEVGPTEGNLTATGLLGVGGHTPLPGNVFPWQHILYCLLLMFIVCLKGFRLGD